MRTFTPVRLWMMLAIFFIVLTSIANAAAKSVLASPLFQDTSDRISGLDWSPDGSEIAIGAASGINILNASTGVVTQSLTGASSPVISVDWSPDGTKIAGASLDSVGVRIWDVSTWQIIMTIQPGIDSTSVHWSPDGSKFVVSGFDDSVGIFSGATGQAVGHPKLSGAFLAWSPDGTKIVAASGYGSQVYVADATSEQRILTLDLPITSAAVDWSSDGTKLATGSDDGNIRIWSATTGELLVTLSGHTDMITSLAFNPYVPVIASSSNDKTIRFWDIQTGQALETLQRSDSAKVVAWSPDGTQLAYGGDEDMIQIAPSPVTVPTITPTSPPTPTFTPTSTSIPLSFGKIA
jgi:WD40 repeat protein